MLPLLGAAMTRRAPALIGALVVALSGAAAGWWACGALRLAPLRADLAEARQQLATVRGQLTARDAVAAAADQRYRNLEQEASHAQSVLLDQWRRERGRADGEWLRLRAAAAGSGAVPPLQTERGGPDANQGPGLDAPGGPGGGALPGRRDDLPAALIEALATGERLEATLGLCQAELRACAALR